MRGWKESKDLGQMEVVLLYTGMEVLRRMRAAVVGLLESETDVIVRLGWWGSTRDEEVLND